jgi:hypothetical protein
MSSEGSFAGSGLDDSSRSGDVHSSVFSQADQIRRFLERNASLHRTDRCFATLQSFFAIFNEQLRTNLELRGRLIRERTKRPYDPRRLASLKAEVRSFLSDFSAVVGSNIDDLGEAYRIFRETLRTSTQVSDLSARLAQLDVKNSELEAKISLKRGELDLRETAADQEHT